MAAGTETTLLAEEGDEHLVAAVGVTEEYGRVIGIYGIQVSSDSSTNSTLSNRFAASLSVSWSG
jgi:hypothetical protein